MVLHAVAHALLKIGNLMFTKKFFILVACCVLSSLGTSYAVIKYKYSRLGDTTPHYTVTKKFIPFEIKADVASYFWPASNREFHVPLRYMGKVNDSTFSVLFHAGSLGGNLYLSTSIGSQFKKNWKGRTFIFKVVSIDSSSATLKVVSIGDN